AAGRAVRDGERTLTWDAKGRLSKVTRLGTTEEYVYGHDDRRAIKRTTAADGSVEVTRYIAEDIEERSGSIVRYAFLGEQRLARLDPVDVGPRTALVTSVASVVDQTGPRTATRAWPITVRLAWSALAAAIVLLLVRSAQKSRFHYCLGWPRTSIACVAVATSVFAACGGGTRQLSPLEQLREESKEITEVPAGTEFYLSDAQSSPLVVAKTDGTVRSRSVYHAYGQVRNQIGIHTDPFGYVGNEEDRGSGLSDFGARPYRPETGVFYAVDPLALFEPEKTIGEPARLFAYAYGGGDPINNADPSGLTFGEYLRGIGHGGVDLVKTAAAAVVQTAKSEIAMAREGRLAALAKSVIVDRTPIVVAARGVAETVRNVSTFGDDFAKAAFAGSDYESGRLAVKPVLTAMSITATVLGATGAGKQLTGRRRAPQGEGKTVKWYHGSLDAPEVKRNGFGMNDKYGDPAKPPYVCVSTDRAAAENAIGPARYDARYAEPSKLGIIEGRMNQNEWDGLHSNGGLRTNEYFGFDGSIISSETKAMTANAVRALNESMKRN
ncbi:MAG TPA: RHS repeat-associated core domain-containing protein, partial [Polyangiaceae bacterium]|nr:RHS repeat-associated core domain-containing protein [Polyangiaceae bacterium]